MRGRSASTIATNRCSATRRVEGARHRRAGARRAGGPGAGRPGLHRALPGLRRRAGRRASSSGASSSAVVDAERLYSDSGLLARRPADRRRDLPAPDAARRPRRSPSSAAPTCRSTIRSWPTSSLPSGSVANRRRAQGRLDRDTRRTPGSCGRCMLIAGALVVVPIAGGGPPDRRAPEALPGAATQREAAPAALAAAGARARRLADRRLGARSRDRRALLGRPRQRALRPPGRRQAARVSRTGPAPSIPTISAQAQDDFDLAVTRRMAPTPRNIGCCCRTARSATCAPRATVFQDEHEQPRDDRRRMGRHRRTSC